MPITFITSDFAYFEFNGYGRPTLPAGLRNPRDVEQIWLDEFAYNADRDPGAFTMLMLHPETIGWGGRIAMLERVLVAMQERGARFVTAEQLADEFRAANAALEAGCEVELAREVAGELVGERREDRVADLGVRAADDRRARRSR